MQRRSSSSDCRIHRNFAFQKEKGKRTAQGNDGWNEYAREERGMEEESDTENAREEEDRSDEEDERRSMDRM